MELLESIRGGDDGGDAFARFAHLDACAFIFFAAGDGRVVINTTAAMRANGIRPAAAAALMFDAFKLDDPELARPDLALSAFENYGAHGLQRLSAMAAAGCA